ncbi:MAG: lipoyl synthase [Nitrospinota bacterium]
MARRLPSWIKGKKFFSKDVHQLKEVLRKNGLHTVCESARCPNIGECFSRTTATFLIMGSVCTRQCRYCAVLGGTPEEIEPDEPERVASAVEEMGLRHVVITSVTRDDLPDGGSLHFEKTVQAVRKRKCTRVIEVLVPDFCGKKEDIKRVAEAGPDIYNHNVETVPSLYKLVRPQADYKRSLSIFETVKGACPDITTKSGLMVGLGESQKEVIAVLQDMNNAGCEMVTIGQYLRPDKESVGLKEYVHPDVFKMYADVALKIGFRDVASAPLVRSSYNADLTFKKMDGTPDESV